MRNMLGEAETWLGSQLREHVAVRIVYRRGEEACELPATVGKTVFEVSDQFGQQSWESRDYMVETAALAFSAGTITPEAGDRIWELRGGLTSVYEVMAPGKEPCFRYTGPGRESLRIHTKLVEEL